MTRWFEESGIRIFPASSLARSLSEERWRHIAKPLQSLGFLEPMISGMAAAQCAGRSDKEIREKAAGGILPDISRRTLVVFCADNGVVRQGVAQAGAEVTAAVTGNMTRGKSCSSLMADYAGARVIPVNVGMTLDAVSPGTVNPLVQKSVRPGTADFTEGPAMSREEFRQAFSAGVSLAVREADRGAGLLIGGEMGIGNTTTSAAVLSCLLSIPPEEAAGRGAGLSDEGLRKKILAIRKGLEKNAPDPEDPEDVIRKVGGLDIAALTGFYLGAASRGIPVILDGVISLAAAVSAARMVPASREYFFPSHMNTEPAVSRALDYLQMEAPLRGGLRLGEGTGALFLIPMLDMALRVYREMDTFRDMKIEEYKKL